MRQRTRQPSPAPDRTEPAPFRQSGHAGTTYAGRAALERRAVANAAEGRQLWTNHRPGRLGHCEGCGRRYPCDDARHGAWLLVYWQPYLPEPALVRPYV